MTGPADPNPTNEVVACLGRKHTGKSQLLHDLYTSQKDRVLSIGVLPQDVARDPDAVVVLGFGPLMDRLKQAAHYPRWHIATALEPPDQTELFVMLVPPLGSPRPSLSKAFGGMALCINELYDVAPNQGCPEEVKRAPRVGRHHELDILFAAQRPASCSRDFTAAADHIYAFAQTEPADLDYLAKSISKPVARRIAQLTGHDYVHFDRGTGIARHIDSAGRFVGRFNTMGDGLAAENARPEIARSRTLAGQKTGG